MLTSRPVLAALLVALPLVGCAAVPAIDDATVLEPAPAARESAENERVAATAPLLVLGAGDALGYAVYICYLASRTADGPVYAGVVID